MLPKSKKDYRDLFKGTATYYTRFRPGYPKVLFKRLIKIFKLDGTGRLLDLGCGTGQLTIPLAPHFKEAVGLDVDHEMISEAKKNTTKKRIRNIKWVCQKAEDISARLGVFNLIIAGASIHWMDSARLLKRAFKILDDHGAFAIISEKSSIWSGSSASPIKHAQMEVVRKYLGDKRLAGHGIYHKMTKTYEEQLRDSSFKKMSAFHVNYNRLWTISEAIGYTFTTSYANKRLLGRQWPQFENELRNKLYAVVPRGIFKESLKLTVYIARKVNDSDT